MSDLDGGPLRGMRVLDLSRVLAGPVCSMVLADLGADVTKVERPGRGDDTREWGPPFMEGMRGMSAYFASVNRNKRSITLDMTQPAGREVLKKLIERSDVLLENFLPSSAAKLGLTPAQLHEINPRLIACSISGFGRTGPWRESPGYDFVVQALSGLMSITGEPEGQPMKVGVALTDVLTGLYAAVAVLAALLEDGRQRTTGSGAPGAEGGMKAGEQGSKEEIANCELQIANRTAPRQSAISNQQSAIPPLTTHHSPLTNPGCHIDLALLDCTLASLVNVAQAYLVTGQRPKRYGNAHPQIVPYECFATADGYIVLAVGNDEQWQRFCRAAGRDDLAADPRFATNPLRVANRCDLVAEIQRLLRSETTGTWTQRLAAAQVPHAPVLNLDEVVAHPQVQARNMVVQTADGLKLVASPIKWAGQPMAPPKPPPQLGEHTDEILGELGYTAAAIRQLRESGVV